MSSPVVDCRSLIEFCKAYAENRHLPPNPPIPPPHHHIRGNHSHSHSSSKKTSDSFSSFLDQPFCSHSPSVAVDVIILVLVVGALGTLTVPYFKILFYGVFEILPEIGEIVEEVFQNAPIPYLIGCVVAFGIVIALWEIIEQQSRKCGKPYCKGMRKAVEFDIQLESEECVKCLPPLPKALHNVQPQPLELVGEDHKALEAELKRMAPPNGRTVLIFRKTCGCPVGRMEVWGPKKLRRIKNGQAYDNRSDLEQEYELLTDSPSERPLFGPDNQDLQVMDLEEMLTILSSLHEPRPMIQ